MASFAKNCVIVRLTPQISGIIGYYLFLSNIVQATNPIKLKLKFKFKWEKFIQVCIWNFQVNLKQEVLVHFVNVQSLVNSWLFFFTADTEDDN